MPNKKGFTLIELLVTVLLIGILAAMALPQYMKVVEKQKGTEAVNILAAIGKAQERYFGVNETYTSDFADLDADLVDFKTQTAPQGNLYNTKYFFFVLDGTDDRVSTVKATRRGDESYILERNYTTGKVCCKNDNTADGDICDVLDIPNDTCTASGETETPTIPVNPPPSSCSGTQPPDTQPCPSGCGTQTRSVSCQGGSWTTGAWTGTCTSPTQTLPTSQSCSGGTQTRTCSASCSGGACGSWGDCGNQTCDQASKPAASQSCGNCNKGTQIRDVTCNNGTWVTAPWEDCLEGAACAPGDTKACGPHAQQTCTSSCTWGTCVGSCAQSQKPVDTQSCGNCNMGTQTRTVTCNTTNYTWETSAWSSCLGGGTCAPGETKNIIPSCAYGVLGTRKCSSSCTWEVVCPTNSQWNEQYSSCVGRHPVGHETKSWTCGTYPSASSCTKEHCISGCSVPGQNTACTGTVSCAATAVSRVNYDCTVYPYEVISVTAVKQGNGQYVCDCKYNVFNVSCSYNPNIIS